MAAVRCSGGIDVTLVSPVCESKLVLMTILTRIVEVYSLLLEFVVHTCLHAVVMI